MRFERDELDRINDETPRAFSKRAAAQRNTEILTALLVCFNERGCFKTGIEHVIAKVGIGKGTLYRHYPSREDLFTAALQAGLDALRVRCQSVWETHRTDPDEGFREVITELVSLNRRREAVSPAALGRLVCGCDWMRDGDRGQGKLEAALVPLVRSWQADRLFDRAADPLLVAAVILALVNAPAIISYSGGEPVEESQASGSFRTTGRPRDPTDRLIEIIRRVFPPVSSPESTAEAP